MGPPRSPPAPAGFLATPLPPTPVLPVQAKPPLVLAPRLMKWLGLANQNTTSSPEPLPALAAGMGVGCTRDPTPASENDAGHFCWDSYAIDVAELMGGTPGRHTWACPLPLPHREDPA